jgi:hypothetical protein
MFSPEIKQALESAGVSASSLDRIRLAPRGVVGKASYVAGLAVCGLAVVAYVLRDPLFLLTDAALIFLLFASYLGGILWFAHKHPEVSRFPSFQMRP